MLKIISSHSSMTVAIRLLLLCIASTSAEKWPGWADLDS